MAKKKIRELKVIGQSGYKYQTTPAIMLKGKWLQEMGFDVDALIKVECEEGRLVITLDAEREKALAAEKEYVETEVKKFRAQLVAERQNRYGSMSK